MLRYKSGDQIITSIFTILWLLFLHFSNASNFKTDLAPNQRPFSPTNLTAQECRFSCKFGCELQSKKIDVAKWRPNWHPTGRKFVRETVPELKTDLSLFAHEFERESKTDVTDNWNSNDGISQGWPSVLALILVEIYFEFQMCFSALLSGEKVRNWW